jgi:hypothetical protein
MATEYRVLMTITFANEADRNTWYNKIKAAFVAAKPASPAYTAANMTKDEYEVHNPITEPV